MARTWYQGFKDGFFLQGKPYEKKSAFEFLYIAGFERVVRKTAEYFRRDGLDFSVPRAARRLLLRNPGSIRGLYVSPDRQMDYDHAYDLSIVMGDRITARLLEERLQVFRELGEAAGAYAGPVVMESFGEAEFTPEEKDAALRFSSHQTEAYGKYQNNALVQTHAFIKGEERSFTIIAWPVPSIGSSFPEIFRETVEVNTMESSVYRPVQQRLVDALDEGAMVLVRGEGNETDMRVMLHPLTDPAHQSNFENCLSDVNIPLGEVFTSPVLRGTEGVLNVRTVYIQGFCFRNLRIVFREGRVTDYSCDNFPDPEDGRALIRKVIFGEKEHLPIGEFAIGTNTRAYTMARKYGIQAKMPILIAEKTGPHFAVGDTCYSFMEDMQLYNPDGKELAAKENECSACRKEHPEAAYFAVHTDITIPYNELREILCVTRDGREIPIIRNGRFVLPGTELLNEALL